MADERNDPPWGRPMDDEQTQVRTRPAERAGRDAPAEAPTRRPTHEQVADETSSGSAAETEAAVTDEPEPALGDGEPSRRPTIPGQHQGPDARGRAPVPLALGPQARPRSTDAVEFIDVKKAFGRNVILNGLNLGLPEGQISMILGPSGTGKSVCIKHMIGLLYPDEGDVLVHGESVPNMADDELFEMRKKFGVLFQDGALFGSMNVFDNTAFPLRQHTDKSEEEITRDRVPAPERGRPRGRARQDAERALGRHAQARRLRARARDEPGHRALRRAGLGPRPGAHGAALRADPGGARRERRRLHGDHARHHVRPPRGRLHRRALEGPDRGVRARRRSCSTPTTSSCASS